MHQEGAPVILLIAAGIVIAKAIEWIDHAKREWSEKGRLASLLVARIREIGFYSQFTGYVKLQGHELTLLIE